MVDKIKEYLNERIEKLEEEKNKWLNCMESTYDEKGLYKELYFKALSKKVELEDVLLKIYKMESGE